MIYDMVSWRNREYSVKTECRIDYPCDIFETTLTKLTKEGIPEKVLFYFSTSSSRDSQKIHRNLLSNYLKYLEPENI